VIETHSAAASIAAVQRADGLIPHDDAGVADPWDHVEAAMALDAAGFYYGAERAYDWMRRHQRRDGSWFASYDAGAPRDPTLDANFTAYIAMGVWHHYITTGDEPFLERMWDTVTGAIDFTLDLQRPDGSISWARDAAYVAWPRALLTSSSCIYLSLRAAITAAEHLGRERPDWELSACSLAAAIAEEGLFEDKQRFAMDWYYPVLAGALPTAAARRRLAEGWDRFVIVGWGSRCVSDRPWVTVAESAELAIALIAMGLEDEAASILAWIRGLTTRDGAYWTGMTVPDGRRWPNQQATWTAAAVVLAHEALRGDNATAALFVENGLWRVGIDERVPDSL
jgi:hypothetical protein